MSHASALPSDGLLACVKRQRVEAARQRGSKAETARQRRPACLPAACCLLSHASLRPTHASLSTHL
ncbi:hypothetical protein BC831DRAFT_457228, partial [Entophlyctis helioformis]